MWVVCCWCVVCVVFEMLFVVRALFIVCCWLRLSTSCVLFVACWFDVGVVDCGALVDVGLFSLFVIRGVVFVVVCCDGSLFVVVCCCCLMLLFVAIVCRGC